MTSEKHPDAGKAAFGKSHARAYSEGPPRQVPGFADLHKMCTLLLAETCPADAHILVLGAGGGLELKALADAQPEWRFTGVDPSADMLDTAREIASEHLNRIRLQQGLIDDAPNQQFDGALCLLTMHFVPDDQRLHTLSELRQRLKPDAPFIMAHLSFPQHEPERTRWLSRHLSFGGAQSGSQDAAIETMKAKLTILSPDDEEARLKDAGFTNPQLFYAGFAVKGWVATA